MEAMKMEHTVLAPAAGTVTELHCGVGDNLKAGHVLLTFDADDAGD